MGYVNPLEGICITFFSHGRTLLWNLQELKDLPRQLRSFRVRDANCHLDLHPSPGTKPNPKTVMGFHNPLRLAISCGRFGIGVVIYAPYKISHVFLFWMCWFKVICFYILYHGEAPSNQKNHQLRVYVLYVLSILSKSMLLNVGECAKCKMFGRGALFTPYHPSKKSHQRHLWWTYFSDELKPITTNTFQGMPIKP